LEARVRRDKRKNTALSNQRGEKGGALKTEKTHTTDAKPPSFLEHESRGAGKKDPGVDFPSWGGGGEAHTRGGKKNGKRGVKKTKADLSHLFPEALERGAPAACFAPWSKSWSRACTSWVGRRGGLGGEKAT